MKQNAKKVLSLAMALGIGGLSVSNAQTTVNCTGSILPANLCNAVSGVFGSGFTITSFIGIIIGLVIAASVIFILFQVIRAIFDWLGKSNDDKARQAAIKSITNAVIAGVVLVVALIIFAILLPAIANVPALGYGCYKSGSSYEVAFGSNQPTGVMTKASKEYSGAVAYDGSPQTNSNSSKDALGYSNLPSDLQTSLSTKVVCKDTNTGNEVSNYIVGKTVGINKTNTTT